MDFHSASEADGYTVEEKAGRANVPSGWGAVADERIGVDSGLKGMAARLRL